MSQQLSTGDSNGNKTRVESSQVVGKAPQHWARF
ncbi:hypothetical protein PI124_g5243 [Phytophthora idaei]|nr:hypothetical protein PI124_g5243 [Phytophthora idaei]